MKRVAALMIAGSGDDESLRNWVESYSSSLGAENLYVYLEGMDRDVPEFCAGVHCHCVDFGAQGEVNGWSRLVGWWRRRRYLSERAAELRDAGYDRVIYGKESIC